MFNHLISLQNTEQTDVLHTDIKTCILIGFGTESAEEKIQLVTSPTGIQSSF